MVTPDSGHRILPGPRPRNIAHRGLALDGAENTLRAFADALDVGAGMLETDIRASRDGVAFAAHDENLSRIAGISTRVARMSARDLAAVRVAGEPLATLEDILGAFPDVPVNIDVKDPQAIRPTARAIHRTASAHRVCLTSFSGRTASRAVRAVRGLTGVAPLRSPSTGVLTELLLLLAAGAPRALTSALLRPYVAVQIPVRHKGLPVFTPRLVEAAHHGGCEVHVWTIDTQDVMRDLLARGADGIVTNRSDLLAEILRP